MAYDESGPVPTETSVREYERQARIRAESNAKMSYNCAGEYNPPSVASSRLTLSNVDMAFAYQPWNEDQRQRGEQVREALVAAAKAILRNAPECPQRTRALNHLIDARIMANAAITVDERF